uniref:Uncharacterized protein n=1 Tax=Arundo donax TaxID=35708 RepID=A0A0A9ATG5_ARUDO
MLVCASSVLGAECSYSMFSYCFVNFSGRIVVWNR